MARLAPYALAGLLVLIASPVRGGDERMFDPHFRERPADEVLVAGPPPLLRAQLDSYVDLFEAAFDLALPRAKEQGLRDALETTYGKASQDARAEFAALVAPVTGLRTKGRSGHLGAMEAGLRTFRQAVDRDLERSSGLPAHVLLRSVLGTHRRLVGSAQPPVGEGTATAWLELVEFVVSLARNEDFTPTSGQFVVVLRDLAGALPEMEENVRRRVARVHRIWMRTKARWDAAGLDARLALRWKVVALAVRAMPAERRITLGPGGDLVAYARAAATLSRQETSYAAWSNLVRQPQAVLDVVDEWLGPLDPAADHVLLYRR